jgi:hypothetical protein
MELLSLLTTTRGTPAKQTCVVPVRRILTAFVLNVTLVILKNLSVHQKAPLAVLLLPSDSITTVNDDSIPFDIFGRTMLVADMAHLLPKARGDAITWNYPACAVLGLDMSHVNTDVAKKAVLGCTDSQQKKVPWYPEFAL